MNKKLSKIALDILGIILALICLSPFYIIIVNSFKTKGELFESTLALPEKFNLDNYTRAWEQLDFIKVLGNSVIYNSCKYSIYSTICIYGSVDVTKNKL